MELRVHRRGFREDLGALLPRGDQGSQNGPWVPRRLAVAQGLGVRRRPWGPTRDVGSNGNLRAALDVDPRSPRKSDSVCKFQERNLSGIDCFGNYMTKKYQLYLDDSSDMNTYQRLALLSKGTLWAFWVSDVDLGAAFGGPKWDQHVSQIQETIYDVQICFLDQFFAMACLFLVS